MEYKKEFEDYVLQVNRLWAEVQKVPIKDLPAEQADRIKAFQAENHMFRQTITQNHAEILKAYDAATPQGKAEMEQQLLELKRGLELSQAAFHKSMNR